MIKILVAIVLITINFYPCLARADTNQIITSALNPPIPDISTWTVTNTSPIDIRVSDDTVAFVGLEVEYNNPADPREFVRVIRRHKPLIISKKKEQNQNQQLFSEMIVVFYNQKFEEDGLKENSGKSDPIVYVRWKTKENSDTGHNNLDGDVYIWFMPPDGNWLVIKNEKRAVEFLTENVGNGNPRNVFAGMEYSIKDDQLGKIYHIIRVDRNDLKKLFKGGK